MLEVVELELPEPGPGEIRVRIVASGINPTDWKTRAGLANRVPDGFQIPHQDGAGVVDAVGNGVTGVDVGRRVWLYLAAFGNRFGTAAEYSVVPADRVIPLPDSASFDLGACLGVPALTAARCLGGNPEVLKGKNVLVAGGAGAVGHYAIELAKYAGARVVATVSSDEKQALAEAAGADLVVRYTDEDVAQQVLDFCGPVDRIVEVALGTNLDLDSAVLGAPATISTYAATGELTLPVGEFMRANTTVEFVLLYGLTPEQLADAVHWTSQALSADALTALPIIPFALDQVVEAQDLVEQAPVGKVVLRVAEG
ncbi:NADPH:quinone reductase [Kribbella turkmenica]|uniref:NADPH:quinone reductase n=1 Tax=Kribbella turkmenica TaxID=2530375 RepID=A0A4R4XBK3_9ACTN|nr:NADPH:quinone reductase [Kribbella turkmenica]